MPCSSATLLRLRSFVTILAFIFCQHDELRIDFFHMWKIFVDDPHIHVAHFLDLVENVEPARPRPASTSLTNRQYAGVRPG